MKVNELCNIIETGFPLSYQESYDNSGLQVGYPDTEVTGILISIDVTEEVIEEAIRKRCNFILTHHPLIFRGIKNLTGNSMVQRCVMQAIQNNIAVYAGHTNLDKMKNGVSARMAKKLNLQNCRILSPEKKRLLKLVTFVPILHAENVRQTLFAAGAGTIGDYDCCSFNSQGEGTFRAADGTNPFAGDIGKLHTEPETRIEVILKKELKNRVVSALLESHPYEEPAYDLYELENNFTGAGFGIIGELKQPEDELFFLKKIKTVFNAKCVRYTELSDKKIQKVALCGGSGSEFLPAAVAQNADIYISADFKYHQFFEAEKRIIIADIGHFESEQFVKEIFFETLLSQISEKVSKKTTTFAIYFSDYNTNPINYL
jgi:dinuclear metal center YbgI/SA1388 family protein